MTFAEGCICILKTSPLHGYIAKTKCPIFNMTFDEVVLYDWSWWEKKELEK